MKYENATYLNRLEIAVFSENMAMMLKTGIQVDEAVGILCEDLGNGRLKTVLQKLSLDIQEMYSVHLAVQAAGCFPKYFVDMVEVGETTGKMDQVFSALAAYYQKENDLQIRVRSAVIYPSVMIILMAAVVFFLIYNVMPMFRKVFNQLGSGLSSDSWGSIEIGFALGNFAFAGIMMVLVLILILLVMAKTAKGNAVIQSMLGHFYPTKEMMYQIQAAKLAYALSTFISSGVDTDRAMELSLAMTTHKGLRNKLEACVRQMREGESLAKAMAKQQVFGSMYGKMFVSSMKSGAQDIVMSRLAELYEQETRARIDDFISAIVPVSAAFMTLIVGTVLVSVMTPLVGIMTSMG